MQSSGRLPKSVGARTTDPVEKQEWLWLAQLAGVTQEGPRRGLTTALDMKVRLLKHTSPTATRDSGSYEIEFPDGRPSAYVYWDDNPGRRSITLSLSSEEAEQIAKELARAEQDKLAAK
jgi:hypothetical protein